MRSKLVIDLGSCYTKIYKAGADVVLCEPTLIAINAGDYKRPAGVGKAAAEEGPEERGAVTGGPEQRM